MKSRRLLVGGFSSSEFSSVYSVLIPNLEDRRLATSILVLVEVEVAFLIAPSRLSGVIIRGAGVF